MKIQLQCSLQGQGGGLVGEPIGVNVGTGDWV